jgi:hypothetical protein
MNSETNPPGPAVTLNFRTAYRQAWPAKGLYRHLPFGYLVGPKCNAERVPDDRSTRRKQECFVI